MVEQQYILLRGREIENIHELDTYVENGGYDGLKKAIGMGAGDVINEMKASGLRGRGGAGFPTGVKWSFIPQNEPIKYVTVNADESETGTFKDREIMETNPHQLIEGSLICAYATGAAAVYIYIRGEYLDVADVLEKAIDEATEAGYAGENIMGSDFSCPVYVHLGAGAYICGEESALLNSLEGKLGQPRVRPPFPAQKGGGLYGEPTVVNNVETLANVPWIMTEGADAYKAIGTEQSAGTKIFCVSGNVKNPGNYELPFGTTFRELLYDFAGGPKDGREFKALLPSGGSGPIVRLDDEVLDCKMSYEHTTEIGTIIGSASLIVMDDSVDVTWVASKVTK
ncbi:MAG: SLBB domain-containing protein, partial [Chloroflexota bacterium]